MSTSSTHSHTFQLPILKYARRRAMLTSALCTSLAWAVTAVFARPETPHAPETPDNG